MREDFGTNSFKDIYNKRNILIPLFSLEFEQNVRSSTATS